MWDARMRSYVGFKPPMYVMHYFLKHVASKSRFSRKTPVITTQLVYGYNIIIYSLCKHIIANKPTIDGRVGTVTFRRPLWNGVFLSFSGSPLMKLYLTSDF